jgi:ribonuclease P protein component
MVFDRRPGRPRLGLVTSSRFLPRAVDRNALRRIVRERFRQRQQALDGLDIVIRLRRSLKGVDGWRRDVARSVDQLLDSLAS